MLATRSTHYCPVGYLFCDSPVTGRTVDYTRLLGGVTRDESSNRVLKATSVMTVMAVQWEHDNESRTDSFEKLFLLGVAFNLADSLTMLWEAEAIERLQEAEDDQYQVGVYFGRRWLK